MKNKILNVIVALLSLLLGFFIISCDIKNPTEGVEVRVKNIPRTTTVRVQFLDAKTQKSIIEGNAVTIDVTFEGQNKNDVITSVNEPITSLSTKEGVIYFAIRDNLKPSAQNPVEVILVCNADKYLTTSSRIYLTDGGTHGFTVSMVNVQEDRQPDGVVIQEEQEGNSDNSGTDQEVQVVAAKNNQLLAKITIPSGTKLKDEDGNVLTGQINTRVTYFDPTDQQSLSSFPGGLNVNTENQGRGSFVSAGFIAVDISVNNTEVKSFEGGNVSIQMDIPEGLMNPITHSPVQPGDKIPLWSLNESNGKWNYEGEYTVTSTSSSRMGIKIPALKHLSYWNLDWFDTPDCNKGVSIYVDGCNTSAVLCLKRASDNNYFATYDVSGNDTITLQDVNSEELILEVYRSHAAIGNSSPINSITIPDACSQSVIPVLIPTAEGAVPIDVTVRGICPNGNVLDKGTLDVEAYIDGNWVLAGRIDDGFIRMCLVVGRTYDFRVFYDGEYHVRTFTVTNTTQNVDIQLESSIELCE